MKNNQDKRFRIIHKEAIITLALYLIFFLWWYLTAYGFGESDPDTYSYIFGLPEWFFYSCILGYILINILLALVLRYLFADISIQADDEEVALDSSVKADNPKQMGSE